MSTTRFCAYCGASLTSDTLQKYCTSCGKPLLETNEEPQVSTFFEKAMTEDTHPAAETEPAYKRQWWQTVAAAILFLAVIVNFILSRFFTYEYYVEPLWDEITPYKLSWIPFVIGWLFLIKGANNRATRIAVLLEIIANICDGICLFYNVDCYNATTLLYLYSIMLIARNNCLCESNRTWVNVRVIMSYATIVFVLFGFVLHDLFDWIKFSPQNVWSDFIEGDLKLLTWQSWAWFFYITSPLCACAMWMIARSEAFTGDYDRDAHCCYSPINKYLAAAVISPVVIIALAIVAFRFYGAFQS